jgi:prephenate dehydrogenase
MNVGIIGFGQLGQFMAKHLKNHFDIFAADISEKKGIAEAIGIKFTTIEDAASKEIVLISVPISEFEKTLHRIKSSVRPNALILDVCSVKVNPCKAMEKILPDNVELIGTHLLFGPQSGANGINGLKIVVCPIRTSRLEKVNDFLKKLGLNVIRATAEEHDKEMAETQILEHFIGRALINLGIKSHEITTSSFNKLLELKDILKDDSFQLFKDIQNFNPFSKKVREKFLDELIRINSNFEEAK